MTLSTHSEQRGPRATQVSQLICTVLMPAIVHAPTDNFGATPTQQKLSDVASSVIAMHHTAPSTQLSFDDLGTRLVDVTFCIVDLETTGGSSEDDITEIGAVLVRGGEVIGELQTLVRPASPIPASIQVLTGITNAMVADAPRIGAVLGSFLEFCSGTVLVAHNARFDVGFLKRACQAHDVAWPSPVVVDTLALARQVLLRDETPNYKLGTLARVFRAPTQPNHRALSDARATVTVLHGLLERVGNLGVSTLEDLIDFTQRVSPDRRAKRTWAATLPDAPGVYWFQTNGEVLYVGKSKNLRRRVRSYFTAAEQRTRIHEMVRIASGVDHVVCASDLEAAVRELRLIVAHAPRYNRRSKRQHKQVWVRLTREPFPRLSVVRQIRPDAEHWGPFPSAQAAEDACLALYDAFPLRRCTARLSPTTPSPACVIANLGRCPAPCQSLDADAYAHIVQALRDAWRLDIRTLLRATSPRLRKLVEEERFEEAAALTQRTRLATRTTMRWHRLSSLARCPEIVAAAREDDGWAIHVIRYGRLAGARRTRRGESPLAAAQDAVRDAAAVLQPTDGLPAASIEEAELIASWLETPGVRLIELVGDWSWPVHAGVAEIDIARHLTGAGR